MKVETTRFGVLEIEDAAVIRMARGLLGFENYRRFCLVKRGQDKICRWLQSVEEPSLAFPLVEPSEFFEDYEVEIADADAEKLHLAREQDAAVFAIITAAENGKHVTVNLAGPIVINLRELIGAQVVVQDNRYSVNEPLPKRRYKIEEKRLNAA